MSSRSTSRACETAFPRGIRRNRTTACSRARGWKPGHSERACYRLSVSTSRKRPLDVVPHLVGARSTSRTSGVLTLTTPGTPRSKVHPNKIRNYFRELIAYGLDAKRSRDASQRINDKKSGKNWGGAMCFGTFLERRQMPTVTLDVVPLPPPRIKPHERTRLLFRSLPIFLTSVCTRTCYVP